MSKQKAGCFNILLFVENYEKSDLLQLMEAGGFLVDGVSKRSYFTIFFNDAPAVNFGTFFSGTCSASFVCGLIPFRAALFTVSKVPNQLIEPCFHF